MTAEDVLRAPRGLGGSAHGGRSGWSTALLAVEVGAAIGAVVLDLWLPTLVLLAMAAVSLGIRRQSVRSLGVTGPAPPTGVARMAGAVLVLSVLWTALVIALVMPALEHATGERQDLGQFEELEGDLGLLVLLLALTWTLAAVGEEVAYRGYLLTRLSELLPDRAVGVAAAVVVSSLVFGLAHTEQGVVGVAVTTLDGIYFACLRWHYRSLWASVLAHGFNNTIGLTTFYLVGPVYGLW